MEPYSLKVEDIVGNNPDIAQQQLAENRVGQAIDESVLTTLKRDLKGVAIKMRYVMLLLPKHKVEATNELKHWDMWGPLLICLFFSVSLAVMSLQDRLQNFINVFLIFWIGGFITAINSKLLGSEASIFQSMSTVGYCLLPLAIFGCLVSVLHNWMWLWLKLLITITALAWSTIACILVNSLLMNTEKKWLLGYPIFLFYVFLAWYSIVV